MLDNDPTRSRWELYDAPPDDWREDLTEEEIAAAERDINREINRWALKKEKAKEAKP
jgi:hypothetical protein